MAIFDSPDERGRLPGLRLIFNHSTFEMVGGAFREELVTFRDTAAQRRIDECVDEVFDVERLKFESP